MLAKMHQKNVRCVITHKAISKESIEITNQKGFRKEVFSVLFVECFVAVEIDKNLGSIFDRGSP